MPCYHPLQAFFKLRSDGLKDIRFSSFDFFKKGLKPEKSMLLPCGNCIGCRLERSRQWAVRCVHEAKLYKDNCFLTLTFDNYYLDKMCPNGSLVKKHVQDFMKRLRFRFPDVKIRVVYCGEYGEKFSRPHYHLCLFNFNFDDKRYWKCVAGQKYYISDVLQELWPFGHSVIGELTFESAAYVARYCVKKVNGKLKDQHYGDRIPEFFQPSLKPGIATGYLDKFGETDIFPLDEVIVRGVKCKPPRFYDKYLEKLDPSRLASNKSKRVERALKHEYDSTYKRLEEREKVQLSRMKLLLRKMEFCNGS